MEKYLEQLQALLRKPDLTLLDVRDGIIITYVIISHFNQTQGDPDIGLKQTPSKLFGHIKGCMAAFFWEQGFQFENPTLDQLLETKIMTDSITQVYAMPENLQTALNEIIDLLVGRTKGQSKSLSFEVQTLLDLQPSEENQPEHLPEPDALAESKIPAEPESEPKPSPNKRRTRKKEAAVKSASEDQEKPKRRKPRQRKLKIDLSSIQMPDDFMLKEGESLPEPAPTPLPIEETPLAGENPELAPLTADDSESINDAELLSKLTLSWQPETKPEVSDPQDESEPAEPMAVPPEMEAWEPMPIPEPSDLPKIADSLISAQPPEEPAFKPKEDEKWGLEAEKKDTLYSEPESELSTEPLPASGADLEESEMEQSEYSTPESNTTPESRTDDETPTQTTPQKPVPPEKKVGLLAAISLLLLGVILGAGGSYYWFGVHKAQNAQAEIKELKAQLADANRGLETAQTELSTAQEQAQKLNQDLDLRREASLLPVAKPKYIKSGRGVVLYWMDKDVMRKYYFYRAKGRKAKLKKISDQPMSKNIMYLKKVSSGTWRYAVSAVDMDGEETELSEVLKLRFPLR
jgi:outer membrane murein-binding lipoprotein Lpp